MLHFIFIAPMHSYVTNVLVYNLHMTIFSRVYSYVLVCTRMLLVCTRMLLVRYSYVLVCARVYSYVTRMHSYVLVCYLYVSRMYSCVTRMLLVCTRVYSYVTRMYSYVTRMLLVCSFSHNRSQHPTIQTDTLKTWMRSNTFIIFFNFCHNSFTTSLNLRATPTFFMLDNELQRIICTLAPR